MPSSYSTKSQVVVGYVAAAAIAVIVIFVHYFLAYQPALDPFRDESNAGSRGAVPFQPNPVDVMILRYIRGLFRASYKVKSSNPSRWVYPNTALTRVSYVSWQVEAESDSVSASLE